MLNGLFQKRANTKVANRERELARDLKVMESQRALLEAATATADAANHVTTRLKARLEDSIAQFENTVRIMSDALIICDTTGAVQAFNPAAERLFDITAEDVRNHFVGDMFRSNSHALTSGADVWALLREMDAAEDEHDLNGHRSDGTEFPVDVNHTQLDRHDGTSIILLVLRDLTPCAETKEQLKSYRSIFESSFDGVLVVVGDDIVAANPAVSYLFGYSVEELMSKSLDMLINRSELFSKEGKATVEGMHQDGHRMEVFFSTTTIQWNGAPASLVTIKDLAINRADKTPDAANMICCFGEDFKVTFVNTVFANYVGERREALIGCDVRDLMPEGERNLFQIHIGGLSQIDPTRRMQLQTTRTDGTPCLQVWTDHASFDADGVEYQRVGRDISDSLTSKGRA